MKLKKPKFWDYKKPNFLSNILFPISKFYELILKFQPTKSMRKIDTIKTICVGNIYIGGTGKTSFAIELMKLCKKMQIKACFIKKFYSDQIDEQKLLEKFGKTFVNKSRLQALNEAAKNEFEIAIFDDGLQDKSILYDVSFVCFNGKNMFGNSRLIPSGPLRESLDNLIKYKNVVINGNQNNQFSVKSLFSKSIDKLNFF
jgi:Tetraacyldisaccharide-1-P 4''-kinase